MRWIVDSSHDKVKPKTVKLVFTATPISHSINESGQYVRQFRHVHPRTCFVSWHYNIQINRVSLVQREYHHHFITMFLLVKQYLTNCSHSLTHSLKNDTALIFSIYFQAQNLLVHLTEFWCPSFYTFPFVLGSFYYLYMLISFEIGRIL